MIVFEYLYGMMDILSPLMDEWANGEYRHVDNEDEDMVRVYVRKQPLSLQVGTVKPLTFREEVFGGSTEY